MPFPLILPAILRYCRKSSSKTRLLCGSLPLLQCSSHIYLISYQTGEKLRNQVALWRGLRSVCWPRWTYVASGDAPAACGGRRLVSLSCAWRRRCSKRLPRRRRSCIAIRTRAYTSDLPARSKPAGASQGTCLLYTSPSPRD